MGRRWLGRLGRLGRFERVRGSRDTGLAMDNWTTGPVTQTYDGDAGPGQAWDKGKSPQSP